MLDFFEVRFYKTRSGVEIRPVFLLKWVKTLMIRGRDFYAVYDEASGFWSTDELFATKQIDEEVLRVCDKYKAAHPDEVVTPILIKHSTERAANDWKHYIRHLMPDNWHPLDNTIFFKDEKVTLEDYATKTLPYSASGEIQYPAYDELMNVLYNEEERRKIEWAIGAILFGDSQRIQKFIVLYGAGGTGKSTVLNIILQLFEGYTAAFDAKALTSANESFALEPFKTNPLVAVQQDGDLSRIEDNTRLNSIVSHETLMMNEKFKPQYPMKFNAFLFMGTNSPVRITDSKSGVIRRLIDVSPTGNTLPYERYSKLVDMIRFELGGIAAHCMEVYRDNPRAYNNYIPTAMISNTNDFYNFVLECFDLFVQNDSVSLKAAWDLYKDYCDDAMLQYRLTKRVFKNELKNFFEEFHERDRDDHGVQVKNYYRGFIKDKFLETKIDDSKALGPPKKEIPDWLNLTEGESRLDILLAGRPAQYATERGTPGKAWEKVKSKLSSLDTRREHFVLVPEEYIVIDFDLRDENGEKSLERNLEAATRFPPTYAEVSRSGGGLHLHYIYEGDVSKLSRVYDDNIEIKVYTGKSALRRKLTACNDRDIARISSGLPLKEGDKKMVNQEVIRDEKHLRALILKCLAKDVHDSTKPNVDFIDHLLWEAYHNGIVYDVTDMRPAILAFAASSTNQADTCLALVAKMPFQSDEEPENLEKYDDEALYFYDVEVFPNLFVVCWKREGEDHRCVKMINPSAAEIELLVKRKLVGFNNRRYDNHILYARMVGYSVEQLYKLSVRIIGGNSSNASFSNAYNLSYTDVYDFASAGNKKSLKKLEIEMGIHHMELGLPWDQPVDESLWEKVADYCCNDVIATEAAFHYLNGDWVARQILADLAGMTVNDSTNSLTTKFIFGNERSPQSQFHYRNLAEPAPELGYPKAYFPGYQYDPYAKTDKSTYRGVVVGEGGYVYAEPGIYHRVALLDIASMHPSSVVAENLFGDKYTARFQEILDARLAIKHQDWDTVRGMLDGKLTPYVQKVIDGELTSKQLANALKTAINSVYGLTAAKFDNAFRDPRNVDNIVAKRGALFMVDLQNAVQEKGFTVAHIKTDSIKIPEATPEMISFVMEFGKEYGYNFEHEATYEKMCLVNDAVYIAKYESPEVCEEMYGYIPGDNYGHGGKWTATGAQFAVPYVFKTLFSHEEIVFADLCETKSVTTALYLDMNENLPEDEHDYQFVGRTGQFCPMKPGTGGGVLLREKDGKYSAVGGTKGYRWLESEIVSNLGKEGDIDRRYYAALVDDAIASISEYGDCEAFLESQA